MYSGGGMKSSFKPMSVGGAPAPAPVGVVTGALPTNGSPAAAGQGDFKGKLNQLVAKKFKKTLGAGDVVYTEVQDTTKQGVFTCTVKADGLLIGEYTGPPTTGRKAAQQLAAKAAIEAEFPGEAPTP